MATFAVKLIAVARAKAGKLSDRRVRVLSIVEVGGIRRALLGRANMRHNRDISGQEELDSYNTPHLYHLALQLGVLRGESAADGQDTFYLIVTNNNLRWFCNTADTN